MSTTPPTTARPAAVRKAVVGASIGNAVEWFDFAIYGFLATFIAAEFFPPATTPPRCWWPPSSSA